MDATIRLYEGKNSEAEVFIVEAPFAGKKYIIKNDFSIDNINYAVKEGIATMKENGCNYTGIISQKPKLDNGYRYFEINDTDLFKQVQQANLAEGQKAETLEQMLMPVKAEQKTKTSEQGCFVTVGDPQYHLVPLGAR